MTRSTLKIDGVVNDHGSVWLDTITVCFVKNDHIETLSMSNGKGVQIVVTFDAVDKLIREVREKEAKG